MLVRITLTVLELKLQLSLNQWGRAVINRKRDGGSLDEERKDFITIFLHTTMHLHLFIHVAQLYTSKQIGSDAEKTPSHITVCM